MGKREKGKNNRVGTAHPTKLMNQYTQNIVNGSKKQAVFIGVFGIMVSSGSGDRWGVSFRGKSEQNGV